MTTINLQLPESLHQTALALAAREKITLEQLVASALSEKISALMTDDYLDGRARRGTRADFERVMAKVPTEEPEDRDRL